MYAPPPFEHLHRPQLLEFIRTYPLGLVTVAQADGRTEMVLAPFRWKGTEEHPLLLMHLAADNPIAPLLASGKPAQIWFQGPQGYISSAWYGHPNVPTWNYQGVEVRGQFRAMTEAELREELQALTASHEPPESPVQMQRLPPAMVNGYMPHVVGCVMEQPDWRGVFKLSQNRNAADHARIVEELKKRGQGMDAALADAMEAFSPHRKNVPNETPT